MNTSSNQIIFAKEVMINLKKIGLSFLLSVALFIILYLALDWQDYDGGIVVAGMDMKYYHEHQYTAFLKDIIGKSTLLFATLCLVLVIGRYILMGYKWISQTSKLDS